MFEDMTTIDSVIAERSKDEAWYVYHVYKYEILISDNTWCTKVVYAVKN